MCKKIITTSPTQLEVPAADTLDVAVTFNFAAGQPGKNEAQISFQPADERVWGKTLDAWTVHTRRQVEGQLPGHRHRRHQPLLRPAGSYAQWQARQGTVYHEWQKSHQQLNNSFILLTTYTVRLRPWWHSRTFFRRETLNIMPIV